MIRKLNEKYKQEIQNKIITELYIKLIEVRKFETEQ